MSLMLFETKIFANAEQIPDSEEAFKKGQLCVLDGLTLSWGRSTQVDQPAPTIARFTLGSNQPAQGLTEPYKVGTPIHITTRGQITTPPTPALSAPSPNTRITAGDIIPNNFENKERWIFTPARAWSANLQTIPGEPGDVEDPGAWDTIRKAENGTWKAGARIDAPEGTKIGLAFITWQSHTTAPTILETTEFSHNGEGTQDFYITQTLDNVWVGLSITLTIPVHRSWEQTPGIWQDQGQPWTSFTPDSAVVTPYLITQEFNTSREILIFQGRVTDSNATTEASGTQLEIIAGDLLAELGSIPITDSKHGKESVATRVLRTIELTGLDAQTILPSTAQTTLIAPTNFEAVKALPVLHECAFALGANLYTKAHPVTGQVIYFEQPTSRGANNIEIPASFLGQAGTSISQDLTDSATAVTVWYQNEDEQAAITLRDDSAINQGTRNTEIKTQLATRADAAILASDWLTRLTTAPAWRISGLSWDSKTGGGARAFEPALAVLSAHTRPALPLTLKDLPAWMPSHTLSGHLEGGTYTFKNTTWNLALNLTLKG